MSRLVRNISYNLAGQAALLVLGFVSARYIYAGLGKDVLGIIYFTVMLNAIVVAMLELGVTTTTVKEVAAHHEADAPYVLRLVRSGGALYWTGYVIAAGAALAAAPVFVARWIQLRELPAEDGVHLLRILGWSTLLVLPQTFYASVFRGLQRMGVTNTLDVVMTGLQQLGIIALVQTTGDVVLVAWWIAAVAVLKLVVLMVMTGQVFGARALVPRLDRGVIARNKKFALPMFAVTILAMIHTQGDEFVVSWILPAAAIGVYGLTFSSVARGSVVTSAIAQGAFPALSRLAHAGDLGQLRQTGARLHDLLCHALVPVYAGLAFLALPVLAAVLDRATAGALVLPAALIALGYYLNGTLTIPYYMSLALDRPDIAAKQNFAALVFTLPPTILLTWRLGITGAAASWVWYQMFAYAYSMPRVCREILDVPAARWFATQAVRLGVIAGTYGLAAVAVLATGATSLWALLAAYAAATLVFAGISWRLVGDEMRARARELIRGGRAAP